MGRGLRGANGKRWRWWRRAIWMSARSGRLGGAHGSLMLGARGCVNVHRNASRHDHRSVIEEIEFAGDAEDHGQRGDEDK